MTHRSAVEIATQWQDAANQPNVERLLALSAPAIELVGPRGAAHGHAALAEWAQRAGAHFTTIQTFARDERVVLAQTVTWHSPDTGAVIGMAAVATAYAVAGGRVTRAARHDTLDAALATARLTLADELRDD